MNDKYNLFLDFATIEDYEDDAVSCGLEIADFRRDNPGMPPCVKLTGTKEQFKKFAEYNAMSFSDIEADLEPVKRPHDKSEVKYVIKNRKGEVVSAPSSDEDYLWDRVTRMENHGQKGLSVVVFNESLTEAVDESSADFSIDFVGYTDDNWHDYDVLGTYYVTVADMKKFMNDATYEQCVDGFVQEYFDNNGKALNGSVFKHWLQHVVVKLYDPAHTIDRDVYNKYRDNGFDYLNIKLINKKLFPTSIEQLQRKLGSMLLPRR